MTNPTRLTVTLAELRELHALPDEALLNVHEAAAFLRLSPNALNWYRSQRRGPTYQRVGPKVIRYRVGDLRAYMVEVQPLSRSYESRKARADHANVEG
ncbi:helix-turn-helix transcriptional regulator [Pseudomonas aeruginosa]